MKKPERKDLKPSILVTNLEKDNILGNSDEIDSEASPLETPNLLRRIVRTDVNSLNTSIVEQEGKIESSPKKNPTSQLFGKLKDQNPFVENNFMAFTS